MPPKVKITKEDIIDAAVQLLRQGGEGAVNARAVAALLGCSTQPVFSNFATMEELERALRLAAYRYYLGFLKSEVERGRYPQYKAFGMAYVGFAREEKELFRFLFLRDRSGEDLSPSPDFRESVEMIMAANGVTEDQARLMHLEMWSCVHGIGTMLVTSFLPLDETLVSDMLSDIYQGIRLRHVTEEK